MPRFDPKNERNKDSSKTDSSQKDKNSTVKPLGKLRNFFSKSKTPDLNIPEGLIQSLNSVWNDTIVPVLIQRFGCDADLCAMFYQGKSNEVLFEVWDPRHVDTKQSQVFKLQNLSREEISQIPKTRDKAVPVIISDWS